MEMMDIVGKAEKLVDAAMKGNDASHDAAHVFRVRDMAVSLALEEGLSSCSDSMEIVSSFSLSCFSMISSCLVIEEIEFVDIMTSSLPHTENFSFYM